MAQRKKRHQAVIYTWYLLVDSFTAGLSLFMGFIEKKKNIEYHQPYTLNSNKCLFISLHHIDQPYCHSKEMINNIKDGKDHYPF